VWGVVIAAAVTMLAATTGNFRRAVRAVALPGQLAAGADRADGASADR
jgi:hypothetical protein